jgi:hypothetical protein
MWLVVGPLLVTLVSILQYIDFDIVHASNPYEGLIYSNQSTAGIALRNPTPTP